MLNRFEYKFKSHPTWYRNVLFRSRLEARWAAFFDLVGWGWLYEPHDLEVWTPDFEVVIPCTHSECRGQHVLLGEVKPYTDIQQFKGHPCMDYSYGAKNVFIDDDGYGVKVDPIPADASAAFGYHPKVTWWEIAHGAGGGEEGVYGRLGLGIRRIDTIWEEAGLMVRYKRT